MTPVLPAGAAAPAALSRPAPAAPRSFGAVLEAASRPPLPPGRDAAGARPSEDRMVLRARPRVEGSTRPPEGAGLLQAVDHARARLEGVLAAARSGRTFTAQELLGLQAEAYRTVQTIDLASKLAEQGAQAVRQTLATQV